MIKVQRIRYWVIIVILGLSTAVILWRYGSLAARGKPTRTEAATEVIRGSIVDRTGRLLAMDTALYNIAVWRPETDAEHFGKDAVRLSEALDLPETELRDRYAKSASDFFYLKKRVSPQIARSIQDARSAGDFEGIVVEKVEGRLYPESRLASHLLGFVGDGNRGLEGLENKYDEDLAPALSSFAKAAKSADAAPGQGEGAAKEAPQGNSLVLTIDSSMQYSLEEIARRAMKDTGAEAIILLAGDARTGEILSYVSMPDFDPNSYFEAPSAAWYDWPSVYSYEPGSVFKVFSLASILDLGGIDPSSTFVCDGAYRRTAPSGEPIVIKCLGVHGSVNVEKILEFSCNAGAAYASDTVQPLDFFGHLVSFGFGSRTGVALPGEAAGFLRSPETWSLRSKPTIAMGQEILVTGVQMMQAAVAVANGGVLMKPIVVRKVLSPKGQLVYENAPQPVRRVITAETSKTIMGAMETVASRSGTGWRAKVRDLPMAVKTGTAQMIDRDTKRYSETDFIASTLAIFPADAPRVVLYLAIIKPKGSSYYGGQIAAPVIRDAAEAVLTVTDLPRGDSPTVAGPSTIVLPRLSPVSIGQTMPDLRGSPKRLLLPLLERSDLKVTIRGEGYVESQTPAPGQPVSAGMTIELVLK
jgi:cell division protein FtsI (penicillin-binding protein 3)